MPKHILSDVYVRQGEVEYRELDVEELAHLKTAAIPVSATGVDIRVRDFQLDVLRGLLRKGLAYIEVPVEPYDRFAIPPLEVRSGEVGRGSKPCMIPPLTHDDDRC